MRKTINTLTDDQIKLLKDEFGITEVSEDLQVNYENQIPNTGIVLVDGQIELVKKSRTLKILYPKSIIGLSQVLNNEKNLLGIKVKKNSKLIIIGKSEILDGLQNSTSKLFGLFNILVN